MGGLGSMHRAPIAVAGCLFAALAPVLASSGQVVEASVAAAPAAAVPAAPAIGAVGAAAAADSADVRLDSRPAAWERPQRRLPGHADRRARRPHPVRRHQPQPPVRHRDDVELGVPDRRLGDRELRVRTRCDVHPSDHVHDLRGGAEWLRRTRAGVRDERRHGPVPSVRGPATAAQAVSGATTPPAPASTATPSTRRSTSAASSSRSEVIYGVAFNTQTWGYQPIGTDGPYTSLNVGLKTWRAVDRHRRRSGDVVPGGRLRSGVRGRSSGGGLRDRRALRHRAGRRPGTTIKIFPEADTFVSAGSPDTNFNSAGGVPRDFFDTYGGFNHELRPVQRSGVRAPAIRPRCHPGRRRDLGRPHRHHDAGRLRAER